MDIINIVYLGFRATTVLLLFILCIYLLYNFKYFNYINNSLDIHDICAYDCDNNMYTSATIIIYTSTSDNNIY